MRAVITTLVALAVVGSVVGSALASGAGVPFPPIPKPDIVKPGGSGGDG